MEENQEDLILHQGKDRHHKINYLGLPLKILECKCLDKVRWHKVEEECHHQDIPEDHQDKDHLDKDFHLDLDHPHKEDLKEMQANQEDNLNNK